MMTKSPDELQVYENTSAFGIMFAYKIRIPKFSLVKCSAIQCEILSSRNYFGNKINFCLSLQNPGIVLVLSTLIPPKKVMLF